MGSAINQGAGGCQCVTGCVGCPVGVYNLNGLATIHIAAMQGTSVLCTLTVNKLSDCVFAFGSPPTYTTYLDFSANPAILRIGGCTLTFDASGSYCLGGSDANTLLRWTPNGCLICGSHLATDVRVRAVDN